MLSHAGAFDVYPQALLIRGISITFARLQDYLTVVRIRSGRYCGIVGTAGIPRVRDKRHRPNVSSAILITSGGPESGFFRLTGV